MLNLQRLSSVFALLLFIVFVYPINGDTGDETVVVFKGDTTNVSHVSSDGVSTTRKPKAFRVPAFVGGVLDDSEFFAVICDAQYEESAGSPFMQPALKTSLGNYKTWSDAVIFGKKTETNKDYTVLRNVTAVMKGKKIYALATSVKASKDLQSSLRLSTPEWDTVMFVGTVVKSAVSNSGSGYTVTWEKETSLKYLLSKAVNHGNAVYFFGGVGNGVVMKDGKIVLPVQVLNKDRKNVCYHTSSIIHSSDNGTTWLLGNPTQLSTSEGSVVEWSDGKLLLSVRLDHGYRVIYESNNMGISWDEFAPFSRVWGNNPDDKNLGSQGSAITVPVNGKNILLVSHPLNTEDKENRETLQLWVSDGKRISCVGTISEDDKGEQTGNSILAYVGDKLYVTHEINPFGNLNKSDTTRGARDKVIAVSLLQDLFDSAKNTVNEWQRLDKECENKGIPADSLVGFLGNTIEDSSVWQDVYNCVNATVNNAISVEGGFRFHGSPESYALWPVQDQGQNQVYKFTDKQFTLSATVIIHNTSGAEEVSVFGVGEGMHTNGILVGLGYTEDRKWITMHGSDVKRKTGESFELGKEYHVAIELYSGMDYVYVNGEEITFDGEPRADSNSSVDFFYMGGTGKKFAKKGSSCTVKNVMLFNQVLSDEEITKLSKVEMYANTNKPTATAEPTSVLETQQTVSTAKPISVPIIEENVLIADRKSLQDNDEKVISAESTSLTDTEEKVRTTEPTNLPDTEKPMSTTTPTRLLNTQKTVSTTTNPLVVPDNQETVLTTELTNLPDTEKSMSTTEPTRLLETQKSLLTTTKSLVVPDNKETVLTTEPTGLLNNDKTVITTELTMSPENHKAVSPTESKETAVTKKAEISEASAKDKNVNLFQRVYRNTTIEEQMNRADGVSFPFIFVKVMCFICSIIVLAVV